ncbi:bidirectional sugar transporter SWEET13-like [Coffea eugenioides]|uniref:bidirectional sugar transporter SWEET13-like n=1 Tax=Coffea eugenioides TaxID=49369 RepID=UPI000F611228|nr:bidirectional sugar transporter SWEET13-like [Coffea eugenioides]
MTLFPIQNPWVFALGILGNLVSFLVYLAPVPTFRRIAKKKSTEGFHSFPYVVSLFSAMLWVDYARVKSNVLLVTVNSIGCLIETIYIAFFIVHAPKKHRIFTLKLVILLNFIGFGSICILTEYLAKGARKTQALGWLCVASSAIVYIAPLSVMKQVISTRSVEFMPFWLSFSLVLNALTWSSYGLLLKDIHITVPSIVGFIFGMIQMALYVIYKNIKMKPEEPKLPTIMKPITIIPSEILPLGSLPIDETNKAKNEKVQEQIQQGEREQDASHQV